MGRRENNGHSGGGGQNEDGYENADTSARVPPHQQNEDVDEGADAGATAPPRRQNEDVEEEAERQANYGYTHDERDEIFEDLNAVLPNTSDDLTEQANEEWVVLPDDAGDLRGDIARKLVDLRLQVDLGMVDGTSNIHRAQVEALNVANDFMTTPNRTNAQRLIDHADEFRDVYKRKSYGFRFFGWEGNSVTCRFVDDVVALARNGLQPPNHPANHPGQ